LDGSTQIIKGDPMKLQLPPVVEAYIRTINDHDAASFVGLFSDDAVVDDIGKEFHGLGAINAWCVREIFDVQVTLEVVDCVNRETESIITAKVDGTFDRTGLPDPLILIHHIKVNNEKIVLLRCRLAGDDKST
jgi:hypothetical protein